MHAPIRDRLEDLLAAAPSPARWSRETTERDGKSINAHLSSCPECSAELESMKTQSVLLHSLRAPEDGPEPAPGFYARVIQRVEEGARDSVWSVFVYSPFGKRLGFASLALATLLSSYVIGLEAKDGHLGGSNQGTVVSKASFFGDQAQQRDAVLVNFVSSQGSLP
ncbi:MAG: hypothetical protein JOY62_14670 [Acidobacteriaceae bacterium]|nr:hypothetical protein [Acidobacteriaceae bacterium]MBV9781204.1 hypothetical protein [Acidobacteriaceae bacterium]